MMPLQRAWDAESQVRNKLSNGPLRVRRKCFCKVFRNVETYVSCQRYVGILKRARKGREFKVAPRIISELFVLDRN